MDKIPAGELIPQVEPIPAIEPVSKEGPIPDTQILARNTVIPSPVLTPAKSVIRATLSKICFLLCCIVLGLLVANVFISFVLGTYEVEVVHAFLPFSTQTLNCCFYWSNHFN